MHMSSDEAGRGERLFLKLGGSLLTDKTRPEALRASLGQDLCRQIACAWQAQPQMSLVLGVGAGSFGHVPAQQYGLAQGTGHTEAWYGAAVTADGVARLARRVVSWLLPHRVPVWPVSPSAQWHTHAGRIDTGNVQMIREALARGLVPLVHGDVMLDQVQGAAIASTEEIFRHLAAPLRPDRILLAGEVSGVLADPDRGDTPANVVPLLDRKSRAGLQEVLGSSRGIDITGGMASKVNAGLAMTDASPGTLVHIFDGRPPDAVRHMLENSRLPGGTRLVNSVQDWAGLTQM